MRSDVIAEIALNPVNLGIAAPPMPRHQASTPLQVKVSTQPTGCSRQGQTEAILVAYDMIEADGQDMRPDPLKERRSAWRGDELPLDGGLIDIGGGCKFCLAVQSARFR